MYTTLLGDKHNNHALKKNTINICKYQLTCMRMRAKPHQKVQDKQMVLEIQLQELQQVVMVDKLPPGFQNIL